MKPHTRFATLEEVKTPQFRKINKELNNISVKYHLPDHSKVNRERYPWSSAMLSKPEYYAARLWEYPFAITSANIRKGMYCVDVGCGMSPFLSYLKENINCQTIGIDPDFFESGLKNIAFGINQEYLKKTNIAVIKSGMEDIPLPDNSVDRVFCISVIEHVSIDIARRGAQEMARILKPGGRLIFTFDVNIYSELSRPLDVIWETGLLFYGKVNLKWPLKRLGIFCDGKQPADVLGVTLYKDPYKIHSQYISSPGKVKLIAGYKIPSIRK